MTEDYKEKLLKYITNNLAKEQGSNIPEFSNVISEDASSLYDELNDAFEYGFKQNGVVQCKNVNGEYNGFIIVYGTYWTDIDKTDSLAKGYMLLFDNNFNLVQLIKQYSSGTDCGIFMKVIVIDDGTLVALDHYDNRNRILLLNNPSIKLPSQQNYILKLRTSYNLQGNVANMTFTSLGKSYVLDKDPNSSNYMIGLVDATDGYEALTQLKINVGSSNTWTNYTYNKVTGNLLDIQGICNTYIYWQNEHPYIYAYNYYTGIDGTSYEYIYKLYLGTNNGGTNITNQYLFDIKNTMFSEYVQQGLELYGGFGSSSSIVNIGVNNYYFITGFYYDNIEESNFKIVVNCIHYDNGNITSVYKDIDTIELSDSGEFQLYNINGTIMGFYDYYLDDISDETIYKLKALLITNEDETVTVDLGNPFYNSYREFHIETIINQFDLYKVYALFEDYYDGWVLNKSDIIYNYLYYNGSPYENVNSLRANQGMLYDINGNIFVRGVYNHVVSDNMTEDTIQIPNTMVNDIQIIENKLMSQTNVPIIINEDTIEKNIYETLYINYFNTINMENRNTNYTIPNKVGAIRVNNAISNLLDYDNMTITKYRVRYHDNTNIVRQLLPATISNGIATFTFSIYTGKAIDGIDLISDDEETTYQSIDTTSYQLNKLYTINQDCYIE